MKSEPINVDPRKRQDLAALTPEQKAVLIHRLRSESSKRVESPIEVIPRNQKLPLSFAQERLWVVDQSEPNTPRYNISVAIKISGKLDIKILHDSLLWIIQRHEILRTTFKIKEGDVVQIISSAKNLEFNQISLEELSAEGRKQESLRLVAKLASRPFNLEEGPLLRTALLMLGQEEYVFSLCMHHIVSDGWSMDLIVREVAAFYGSALSGKPVALPDLKIQYVDFAFWQRRWLEGGALSKQLNYWKAQLSGKLPVLALPTSSQKSTLPPRKQSETFTLSSELRDALINLGQREGGTLFITVLAAFKALLFRYSGQTDIIVGTPIANRNRREIEGLIGFFVNMLALRDDLSGNPSFRELLHRVKATALGAYANQDIPFDKLVEELRPERAVNQNPIFRVAFTLQDATKAKPQFPGLDFVPLVAEDGMVKFDLVLTVTRVPDGLIGNFEYKNELFTASAIKRFNEHFITLINEVVKNPDVPIGDLEILTNEETHGTPHLVEVSKSPMAIDGEVDPKVSQNEGQRSLRPLEKILVEIWEIVLKRKDIPVDVEFFQLGGTSLKLLLLVSEINKKFKKTLFLTDLFEHLTIEKLAVYIESITTARPPIVKRELDRVIPLSFAQERLWFLNQLEPESVAYNISAAVRVKGELKVGALQAAINEIIRRHEALRTTFELVKGRPVQVIHPDIKLELTTVELEDLNEENRSGAIKSWIGTEAGQPFDLSRGPLIRTRLLRLSPTEHVVFYTLHHIVSDEWSMGVLMREVSTLYETFSAGQPSPLQELPIQYADYAVWQRAWLQGEVLEQQLQYWKEHLAGAPAVLELPTDRPRPAVQSYRGASRGVTLSREVLSRLNELSRREGATLFMTVMAAFKVLLHRYTGQTDVVVGSPIANRTREQTEGVIGFFVNTLALRTDLSGDPTFLELLQREREVALGAYAHQDVPFEQLVQELQLERNLSHNPLFQVMLVLQNAPEEKLQLGGLEFAPAEWESRTAKFDLTLKLQESAEGLLGVLEYSTDLFDDATMARLAGHWESLLGAIVKEPQQRLSELELLSAAERQQLLVEWNDTQVECPRDQCIHELFEAQVKQSPEAVAVVFEAQRLMYGELNKKANQLAHYLRGLGVGPEVPVGICLERSLEMVIGLLGILKAGGAYVAIDPKNPKERIDHVLRDAEILVLLTQRSLQEKLPQLESTVLYVDEPKWGKREDPGNPTSGASPENIAYVIYTSGSTGQPKGVMVEHQQLTNYVGGVSERMGLGGGLSYASVSTIAADLGNTMIFPALCGGGTLHLISEECAADPQLLGRYFKREEIDCLKIVPSHLKALQNGREPVLPRQRLILGGEASLWEWVKDLSKEGSCEIYNHYGPTETTVGVIGTRIGGQLKSARNGTVPLGRPLGTSRIYLLDRQGNLVPVGGMGEIYVGGEQVSRGYLNRPDLTAEKFVPDEFGNELGSRLYRTGDLGRYQEDGSIEFVGRVDDQIKLRGYRIEPDEVREILSRHPEISQAAMVIREDIPGEKYLVAYVVGKTGAVPTADELKVYLRAKLPEYMVPTFFVMLEQLPLTPNGKLDRKALPAPEASQLKRAQSLVAPSTPMEEMLAEIWRQVLRLEQVGVHDNFFELGGHSLLTTELVSRVREACQVEVPLRTVFKAPTVFSLSKKLEEARLAGRTLPISVAANNVTTFDSFEEGRPTIFLIHDVTGDTNGYELFCHHINKEFNFFQVNVNLSKSVFPQKFDIENAASVYLAWIKECQPSGPYRLAGWSVGGAIAYEIVRQMELRGDVVVSLSMFDTRVPRTNQQVNHSVSSEAALITSWLGDSKILAPFLGSESVEEFWIKLLAHLENDNPVMMNVLKAKLLSQFEYLAGGDKLSFREVLSKVNLVRSISDGFSNYFPQSKISATMHYYKPELSINADHTDWQSFCDKKMEVFQTGGGHLSMFSEPSVVGLANLFKSKQAAIS